MISRNMLVLMRTTAVVFVTMMMASGCTKTLEKYNLAPQRLVDDSTEADDLADEFGKSQFGNMYKFYLESLKKVAPVTGTAQTKANLNFYMRDGRNLSRAICSEFLETLGDKRANHRYRRKIVLMIGGMTEAIMGVVGVNASTAVITALGFSNILQGMDDFEEWAYLAKIKSSVQTLVKNAQESAEGTYKDPETFIQANLGIQAYEYQCSRDGIRTLIGEAVASAATTLDPAGTVTVENLLAHQKVMADARLRLRSEKRARLTKDLQVKIKKAVIKRNAGLQISLAGIQSRLNVAANNEESARQVFENAVDKSVGVEREAEAVLKNTP